MVKLSKEDVLKLARLSRIKLSDSEIDSFKDEIDEILGYVEKLSEVDTKGLKPTYQVTGLTNVMRTDEVKNYGLSKQELMKNVPKADGDYIKVKRMIG